MTDAFDSLKAALADRYALEHELGSGGMATVHLAEDMKLHRSVSARRPPLHPPARGVSAQNPV